MTKQRVFVAMSGGVDSSVAAALLKDQGYDVCGITCTLFPEQRDVAPYAQEVARRLNIPHEILDLSDIFARCVTIPFCHDYCTGHTPNPCVSCNRDIKFGAMLDYARARSAHFFATGHYARIGHSKDKKLLRAVDKTKDQSYFLYILTQSQLTSIIFPLGEILKSEVIQMADQFGLTGAIRKEESQDLCFIPNGNYVSYVTRSQEAPAGEIADIDGRVIGQHQGLAYYTIGQRKGLGITTPTPLYVIKLDVTHNQVVVGPQDALYRRYLTAKGLSWVAGVPPTDLSGITARVRYKSPEANTNITLSSNTLGVEFLTPQWGIAPGQSIVFYRGEEVLGGGIIE